MAWRTCSGDRFGFACKRTAAAPAMCGDAALVPDADSFPYIGPHGPTAAPPVLPQLDEMSMPGAVTSGWYIPIRYLRNPRCPPGPMESGTELSNISPLEEKP